jgi:hypothetical protein
MSLWFGDTNENNEPEERDGYYCGIFTAPPAVIASTLPRPPSPFVRHDDAPSKGQSVPCTTAMLFDFVPARLGIGLNRIPPISEFSVY